MLEAVRRAVAQERKLAIVYAGSRDRVGRRRVVRPHELLVEGGRFYCIAWCEAVSDWRHFRLDRMLDALVLAEHFAPEADYEPPRGAFRPEDAADGVTVRFGPAIARWLRERYPEGSGTEGEGWEVEFDVADPIWLVRHVLYYGPEAEVVGPEEYREAVVRAVATVTPSA